MRDVSGVNPTDAAFLAQAHSCAASVAVKTAPNPKVGCVIVDRDGHVVATGVTEPAGGRHAERVALDSAFGNTRGATVYVTLEPCNHHGRTPPCTDALISAGVAKVVYAVADPNPIARGGAGTLVAAGIAVSGPLDLTHPLACDVTQDLAGFFMVTRENRPYITLKLAQEASGNTVSASGRYLTGEAARRDVHRLRRNADAVLVGANTVNSDNPQLTVRHADGSKHSTQPRAVVFDRTLSIDVSATVCRPGTLLVTTDIHPTHVRAPFERKGVTVCTFSATGDDTLDVKAALATLVTHGVNDVLAEPGLTLAHTLIAADVVDTLILHVVHATDGTFTPCVPLEGFTEVARQVFDRTDVGYTYVANRKIL